MIEIITFRLHGGADIDTFLAIDGRVQTEVAYQCPGLLRRTLARDGERWLVLQIWLTPEAGTAGGQELATSPLGADFMSFVDSSTLVVDRFGSVE